MIRFCWLFNKGLQLRPSQPGHPTLYSGDPRLGQQCVAGRPLCLFGTGRSSCSSTEACHFVVGSADCATSIGTTVPGPTVSRLSQHGCWFHSTADSDDRALATTGFGKCRTGFGGALTPSPLPTGNGAPDIARCTITSLRSTACPVMVGASPAAAQLSVRPRVCSAWLPPNLTLRVLLTADVES